MRYFSTFSGIGGFEFGIHQAHEEKKSSWLSGNEQKDIRLSRGQKTKHSSRNDNPQTKRPDGCTIDITYPKCIGYSEIDKYAIQIYERHFKHKNFGSIRDIVAEELPDFELLCGGFPCQSFSIAGKRGGFEDTRGTLFFDIARIAKVKKPRLLWLENVKGLLSHEDGRTFNTIIATLDELGYDVQWQVLNSKNFGVPQNRERVFIIGHLRGTPRPEVFPFRENSEPDIVLPTLMTRYYAAQANGGYIGKIAQANQPKHSNDRVYKKEGIAPTLNTAQGGRRQPKIVVPVLTPDRINKRQNGRRFKEDGEESFTLTAQDKHGIYDVLKIRRLTPLEYERLQGFPDNWTEGVSDSQRYKCLGNAVTVNVIKAIAKKLL